MSHHDRRLPPPTEPLFRKDAGDPFEMVVKRVGDLADATTKRLDRSDCRLDEMQAGIDSLAQRLTRGGPAADDAPESWGAEFVRKSGDQLAAMARDRNARVGLSLDSKALMTTAPNSAGSLVVPTRDANVLLPRRRLTIRDLLPVVSISTGSVEYVHQDSLATNAATVPEGMLKPESAMALSLRTTSAKVIAHWIKVSKQVLEDAPQLRDLIDTEMIYGLMLQEEAQLLFGDGTGANLLGLVPSATPYVAAFTPTAPTALDTIGLAALQVATANFEPDGVVVHPADWLRIRLTKDSSGRYIFGDPQASVELRLWGLRVVPSPSMMVDKVLVGCFARAATLYDRWAPRVEAGFVNDDWTRNLLTLLCESRIALATKQPGALVYGDLGYAS